jgi:fatty-acyl-CoA synthase
MAQTYFDFFQTYAEQTPDKVLLRIDEDTVTYREFMEETARLASGMRALGIQEDDKVGLLMPNSIAWYLVYWAAIRIGAQPVPIDPQSGVMELSRLLPASTVKICFAAEKYRTNQILQTLTELIPQKLTMGHVICMTETLPEQAPDCFITEQAFREKYCSETCDCHVPAEDHIMSLACTSGSTGIPKILSVPYYGFLVSQMDMGEYLGFTADDVMMIGMTLYHQGGFGMGLQMTLKGGTVLYQPQFQPVTFLETVEKYHITAIQLTSTLAKVLLSTPNFSQYDLSSVRICYFAGEVLPKELADVFVKELHIRVINVIGSSETATMVVWDSARDGDVDPSDFRKLPFTDAKVIDAKQQTVPAGTVGELCVKTDAVITEYFGNPTLSQEKIIPDTDGKRWFCTGDLVQQQEDGRLRFAGRSKRIIKRGGNLVHAEEVEACLLTHPDIAAAAVTAEEHPAIGQQIVAYIQPNGDIRITRGQIAKYFDGKLSAYKVPDKVVLVEEIPKDIGKIQFKYLRRKEFTK